MKRTELIRKSLEQFQTNFEEPKIPKGFTILYHGTNLGKWEENILVKDEFIVRSNSCFCTAEEKDINYAIKCQQPNFAFNRIMIKIIFPERFKDEKYINEIRQYKKKVHKKHELIDILQKSGDDIYFDFIKKDIQKVYYDNKYKGNHPVLPSNMRLIKMHQMLEFDDKTNESVHVLYFIPDYIKTVYDISLYNENNLKTSEHIKENNQDIDLCLI